MTLPRYPLRVALIGAGGIARTHARAYTAQPDRCTLVAVTDIAPQKAEGLAAEFNCRAYPELAAMLDDVHPDVVSVCTPPAIHLQGARAAIERGIPALCEKPLSHDSRTAREMVALAQQHGVLLMTALCHRFHGPVVQLKELLDGGKLGQVLYFQNRFASRFNGVQDTWFVVPEVAGGGVLIDTEVHAIDLFCYLVGQVVSVSAQISTTLPIAVEDSAVVTMRSADGVPGVGSCSWVSPPGEAIIQVFGSEGTAVIDYNADQGQLCYRLAGQETWTLIPYAGPDRFVNETAHFLECVATSTPPRVDGGDGARILRIIEAAYRAAANGTTEPV
jgi:UDP-N-acetylglucosamine 3-dehydrogenase